ncbi:methyltransferase domain-containing protein [Methanosalsum natronophilum]|uniref:tRNA (guanine(10)-N(2))-dimethyltransferase n=1 Tax=Methanosalsum natronophilum TaxID=768733 RepID=A0A424YLY4_9EURY|nr:MAG: methyltransferase domain-containing protein [Methanosalsum natronophilum]
MLYAVELSGEHETISCSETLSCLSTVGLKFSEVDRFDQAILLDIKGNRHFVEAKLKIVAERLALARCIIRVIDTCEPTESSIVNVFAKQDIPNDLQLDNTYVVRVKKVRTHNNLHGENLEKKIGGIIHRKGYKVNLQNPDRIFRILISKRCIIGSIIVSTNRTPYEERAPHNKPFFYPGVLMPKLARSLVNISKLKPNETFLDPFCGTGGILVEAGLLASNVVGLDVQEKIISGARLNLKHYEVSHDLIVGNATVLPIMDNSIDSIVTDPPYGRSALVYAKNLNNLYLESLLEIYRVLKPEKIAVVVTDKNIDGLALKAGFNIVDTHYQYVHRSLTRIISVLIKA